MNKMDLLPYANVDPGRFIAEALEINPKLKVYKTSATRGDGMDAWLGWLLEITGMNR
ncbi:MAG: 1-(5-phosphoribosyl)-5-[(5-phosphoribosylamino)methylideneamino] imidazole-4-carboxamide isomerase [Nitrospinae bacterium]|nr:1-(5-phosphoribosyl)-5-[(5-phosphoribosylamino)methylideneamino] imidazole-4-carboxamide isomerase [Nitrospinota bacterium]